MDSTEDDAPSGSPQGEVERQEAPLDETARTRAELRRAREDLDVFSHLSSGYWWCAEHRPGGMAVEAWTTRNFSRTTGRDRGFVEALLGAEGVHPDDAAAYGRTLDALKQGAGSGGRDRAVHEFRLFGRDDSILWVRQRLEARGSGAGRRIYASGELITERKRTEDALGHVEARFLSLVEHAPNVIVTIDLEGTILFVNRPVPVDDREPWELIGTSVFELGGGQGRAELEEAIAKICERKGAYEFSLRAFAPGVDEPSAARWYQVQGAPVMRGGEVAAITMILTDVTERHRAELALRRSEARWRFLWENVPDQITEFDEQGRVLVSNREFGEKQGAELIGASVLELLTGEPREALGAALDEARRTGEASSYELAHASERPGERERWWSHRLVPYFEGGERGFLLIATDVTDHKVAERERANLEAQLRQQQKLESIGTLASGVAHEINNPIQSIMNYADLVRLRAKKGGDIADFAGEIVVETERVASIVRNLLAFARQEKEHHGHARISDIVDSALLLMRTTLKRDQVTLRVDVPADLPEIKCRSQQIQQVFMNMIDNAREALNKRYPEYDEGKWVAISARLVEREGEAWVCTTIEDHGCGMKAEVVDRVFDPFFTTKGRDASKGLGLSVGHGIVREHRGELEVESVLGEYTRFHISLRVDNGWGLDWSG